MKSNQRNSGDQPQGVTQELRSIDSTICNTVWPRSPWALAESQQTEEEWARETEQVFRDPVWQWCTSLSFHRLKDGHVALLACKKDWAMLSSWLPRRYRKIIGKYIVVYATGNCSGHWISIQLSFPSIEHTHSPQLHHPSILGRQLGAHSNSLHPAPSPKSLEDVQFSPSSTPLFPEIWTGKISKLMV